MRHSVGRGLCALALAWAVAPALAHGPNDPPHQSFPIGDFKLESGEVIKDFAISYVTHGTLNPQKSNAVLMVTAISGNHHRIDFMIGAGKPLDPAKYFVVATDAIGNGLTTSPSNSKTQKGPAFPHFTIRDMVDSQWRLMQQLDIRRIVTVVGASMGGMQALQWGVSHPDFMDSLIALVPMARTPAWSIALNEATRKALMLDPTFNNGNYTSQPEQGWRLRADILNVLGTRTPEALKTQFPNPLDVLPWMKTVEDTIVKVGFDANDWIAQTWAYDRHNVGDTPGFNGDHLKALRSIKAKTLLLTGELDLYNPVEESVEAVRYVPDARLVRIPSIQGHVAAAPTFRASDIEFINQTSSEFLGTVAATAAKPR
jgi:homoserine O-acetyltransferase